jgi:hypothetical protein
MKIAVINFSGNVGKSTVARHLLQPRIEGADFISVESLNAAEGQAQTIRGRQFAHLQEYLQTVDSAVVDIGASNVEELLALMRQYRGSHEDFDAFVVPTVPAVKQQQDSIATLIELSRIGVPPSRVRLLFNMVETGEALARSFQPLLSFVAAHPVAQADLACRLGANEIYGRLKSAGMDIAALVRDGSDYKALIAQATDTAEKLALAQKLATRRLAHGVLPELDACFAALHLETVAEPLSAL